MKIFSQTKLINLLLLMGMIVLTLCGILAYRQVQRLFEANYWVVHTHKVIEAANKTLLSITTAESQLNFYELTHDKSSIQDLPKLIDVAQQNIRILKSLVVDNPIQVARVHDLEGIANEKIALLQQIYQMGDSPAALIYAKNQKRAETRRDFIRETTEINQEEENLLETRNDFALREAKVSGLMFIIFGVLSELFILLSLILLNYNLHQRNIAERKQIEAENKLLLSNKNLQESEERYLLATEGSSAGLWDWEVGTDRIFFSPYFKKMLGYTDEEFPNSLQSFEKTIHPNDHDRVWELVKQHFEKRLPYKVEYRLRTKSGSYNWFQSTGQAIWNDTGVPIRMSGSTIDIVDRKKAEQRLSIQHYVSEILSEASTLEDISTRIIKKICEELGWEFGVMWMIDDEANVLVSTEIWYQPSPLLKKFEDKIRNMQFARGVGLPGRIWETGKPMWMTDINKDKNFSHTELATEAGLHSAFGFPIMIHKKVLGIVECFTIESESLDNHMLDLMMTVGLQIGQFLKRKMAENELRTSEAYKTAILEAASDSIITINEQKNIVSFNSQTTKAFNSLNDELLNKNIETILPKFDSNIAELPHKSDIEILGIRKTGESFPVEIKISKMDIDRKNMSVIIVRDITERKKIEKMKSEFVSVVSHELRTPLTSIRGALGLVLGGAVGTLPEKVKKLLDLANNNCERLLLLINDILDIEKIEAGKMSFSFKVIDVNQLVNEAIAANQMFAEKYGVRLKLTQSESNLELNVDPDRLMQVLANLISNAIKFSPKGDEVTLTIKQHQENVRVLISNKGAGIPNDFQSHIFQKFSQVDTSDTRGKGGTGLGLNISKAIIEKLGGTLNFISKPDEITTFYFDLPLWKTTQKIIEAQKNKAASHGQDRILICEDDEDQASYLSQLLESAGFQIDISYTVAEAKQLLAKNTYHVLLLDLILPDQDGISFIRELRSKEQTYTLPIIVLSVISQTGRTLLNGDAFAVVDWLDKPIDFNKLLQAMQHIKKKTYPAIPNILHVEDDIETFEVVKTLIGDEANVILATTIQETIEKLNHLKIDLVILDLLLPDGSADQFLPLISKYKLPIIVYSANELDKNLSKLVKHVLVKSRTSNEQLLGLIKHLLEKDA